jgi:NarL family two-component system response regulator LiaR
MSSPGKIRVALIDDHRRIHEIVADVLKMTDDIELIAQGSTGEEALQLCASTTTDVILMDVLMPVMDGIDATRLIHERYPTIKILALSSFQDDDSVRAMIANGAIGYVLKGSIVHDLVSTIRATYLGKAVFSVEVTQTLMHSITPTPQSFGLTDRELEVLRLVASGQNNGEIAARLTISQSTVKFHMVNIMRKMNVETRAEAIVLSAKHNLL